MEIHNSLYNNFVHNIERNTVPHAILLSGKSGYGLLPLAINLSEKLLCQGSSPNCAAQAQNLVHPDLHLIMPTFSGMDGKDQSKDFLREFRAFYSENPFGGVFSWMTHLGVEKKQGTINAKSITNLLGDLSLQSFSGGYKVVIIWLAEFMNSASANKILKILEEPPKQTVFFLLTENANDLLPTILSRCQTIQIPRLGEVELQEILAEKYDVEPSLAKSTAEDALGDVNEALDQLKFSSEEFEQLFIDWVRNAFLAKKQLTALAKIREWSIVISAWNRERQKMFLQYCAEIFRNALLLNYGAASISKNKIRQETFNWEKFAPFIHGANIEEILSEINTASYHIERNGNAKIIFLDLGIKLIRFIHKKEEFQAQ